MGAEYSHGKSNRAMKNSVQSPPPEPPKKPAIPTDPDILNLPEAPLLPFDPTETFTTGIPFTFDDYLELIDTVGRAVHPKKRGFIPDATPAILQRLNISTEAFIHNADQFLRRFGGTVGHPARLIDLAASRNVRYLRGMAKSKALFGEVV